jgi:hypothetical protein
MRLTLEEHREAIKRYRHVKPARGWRVSLCAARCPGLARSCTLEVGHRGPHVAHGFFRKVLAVWASDVGVPTPGELPARDSRGARPRGGGPGGPIGLRPRAPVGILEALRERLVRIVSSADQIAFLIFFLAFVGFAVHWFVLILE